jgi:LysM repeat protein
MSSPSPLIPQGSLLEQQAKSKSTFHVAALIVGLHVFLLGGLLILGCKKEEPKPLDQLPITDTLSQPPPILTETNLLDGTLPLADSLAQPATNPVPPVTYEAPVPPPFHPAQPLVNERETGATVEYVVKKGDLAGRIANRNKLSLKQLQEANSGVDLAKLKVGQKINLPAGTGGPTNPLAPAPEAQTAASEFITYTVKGGDTLTKLARKHGTTIKAIREASGLKSNDLKIGQKLKLPAKAAAPAPAPEPIPQALPAATPVLPTVTPIGAPAPR